MSFGSDSTHPGGMMTLKGVTGPTCASLGGMPVMTFDPCTTSSTGCATALGNALTGKPGAAPDGLYVLYNTTKEVPPQGWWPPMNTYREYTCAQGQCSTTKQDTAGATTQAPNCPSNDSIPNKGHHLTPCLQVKPVPPPNSK